MEASTDHGYENAKLGKLILDKTVDYRTKLEKPSVRLNNSEIQSLTAVGIVLSETSISDKVNVIDFGGAWGDYFLVKRFFDNIEFDWKVVVETKTLAHFAQELKTSELSFHSDLSDVCYGNEPIHLVHSSGTLQCVENPYGFVKQLIDFGSEYLLLSRLGLTGEQAAIIVTHQHMMSEMGRVRLGWFQG